MRKLDSPAYSSGDHNTYFQLEKEGKEPLNINTNTDYKQVIKQIVNYFED